METQIKGILRKCGKKSHGLYFLNMKMTL